MRYYLILLVALVSFAAASQLITPDERAHYSNPNNFQEYLITPPELAELQVKDDTAAMQAGFFALHVPSATDGACGGSCHGYRSGGVPLRKNPVGGKKDYDEYCARLDSAHIIDISHMLNPRPVVASFYFERGLNSGKLVTDSESHWMQKQLVVGSMVHEVGGLGWKLRDSKIQQELYYKAFGTRRITDELARKAAFYYQARHQQPYEAPFQQWLRGERAELYSVEGWALVNEQGCLGCHNGKAFGGNQFAEMHGGTIYMGLFTETGDSTDIGRGRVAGWYNTKLSAGLNHDMTTRTVHKATKKCAAGGLSVKEIRAITKFINWDLTDNRDFHEALFPAKK